MDKIEYNIEDDPDSKSNSILEMLRKVPLVTVDGEDNVQVNGSSSFKIHVNGKPNNMMSNNPKEVLKSMPANTIKYIEVITSPGAKYDAEGIGGILNIVTVGSGFEGYTATFRGNANNNGVGAGTYAMVKQGKLTVSPTITTIIIIVRAAIPIVIAKTTNRIKRMKNIWNRKVAPSRKGISSMAIWKPVTRLIR